MKVYMKGVYLYSKNVNYRGNIMTIHEYGINKEKTIVLMHPSAVMWNYFEYAIPLLFFRHVFVPMLLVQGGCLYE